MKFSLHSFTDYGSGWDASNDFSNTEIIGKSGSADDQGNIKGIVTKYIPVYINGELYYGEEPDGTYADGNISAGSDTTLPSPADPATSTTKDEGIVFGDANCDGKTEIADATLILQMLTNKDEYQLTEKGMINADVSNRGDGITASDALSIMKLDAGVIDSLPESYSE